jgi:hypothetical protein
LTTALLTPELVLVDPELAQAQRQTTYGKAAMSSTEPANGMFFVDQAQPEPDPEPQLAPLAPPAPAEPPAAAVEPVPAPEPEPVPEAEPAPPAPAVDPAPSAPPPAAAEASAPLTTPMVDVPLGTLIFRAGLLAEEQLEDALQEGMRTGKRLGEVLIERGWIAEKDLGRMLAGQKGLPYIEVTASDAEPDALKALPEQNARLQVALPLHYEDGELVVAVADPSNELVIENLRRALGSEPKLVVAPHGELLRAIDDAYGDLRKSALQPQAVEPVPAPAPPPAPQAVEPAPAPSPEPAPEPPAVEPAPEPRAVEPAPEPEPVPQVVEPAPAPAPAPELVTPEPQVEAQPEPIQPLAPAPLPTVLPPAQERSAEPEAVPPLQTPAAEAAPEPIQPLASAPAPLPVAHAPAPVAEQPLSPPEPAPPAAPEEPAQPLAQAVEVEPAETAPPPAPPVAEAPRPVEPALEAAPAPEPQPEPAATLHVVLRLQDGETLQVGSFTSDVEASTWAQEIVRQIASAEGQSAWPFFSNRYLRPDTIVSIDLVEESEEKWLGSSVRSRWAEANS